MAVVYAFLLFRFSTTNDIHYATAVSEWAKADPKLSRFTPSKLVSEPLQIVIDPTFSNELSILNQIKVRRDVTIGLAPVLCFLSGIHSRPPSSVVSRSSIRDCN